jgi:hypothetical protein
MQPGSARQIMRGMKLDFICPISQFLLASARRTEYFQSGYVVNPSVRNRQDGTRSALKQRRSRLFSSPFEIDGTGAISTNSEAANKLSVVFSP